MLLRPSRYKYRDNAGNAESTGFIAQEVQDLYPEVVTTINDGRIDGLALNHAGFSVLAIAAIQERQVVIESLDAKVEDLEKRLASVESQ